MNIMRVSIVTFLIATQSNTVFANQYVDEHKDKDETQGTVDEPDCEHTSAPVYL
jgi:hypothetical protein